MSQTQTLIARLRGYRRLPEILAVLVRHGFADVLAQTGLDKFLPGSAPAAEGAAMAPPPSTSRAVRVRMVLEDLGPTFIKFGQILSTRPDLIPPEWAEEFKRLQTDCPQVEYEKIEARLEEEFGDRLVELFQSIERQPLAAASMAQVHRAVYRDGSNVVIKVLRPGIEKTIASDMELLSILAQLVEHYFTNLGYDPTDVVDEFARELRREIDFAIEGKSTDRLRRFFADDPGINFPRVYWDATTSKALTLEEIEGTLLSRLDVKSLPQETRRHIIENGASAVFRQCLEFGFFHADPHPGNIIVLDGGQVCFIDCGMTGHLDARTTEQLADMIASIVSGDLDRVMDSAVALADVDPMITEDRAFRADASEFVSHFDDVTLGEIQMGALLEEFFAVLRKHKVQCPSDLVFLIKAISTIEGVGREIDPTFDLVSYVRPHIERLVASRYGFKAIRKRFERSMVRYAELAESLPGDVQTMMDRVKHNRFSMRLEHHRLGELNETLEHASRNIAHAFIIASLLVSSAILILSERISGTGGILSGIGIGGLIGGAALIVILVVANLRRSRKRGRG